MPKVIMCSDVFGSEEFGYETEQEARDGFERLKAACQSCDDGIKRHLLLAIDSWPSDE